MTLPDCTGGQPTHHGDRGEGTTASLTGQRAESPPVAGDLYKLTDSLLSGWFYQQATIKVSQFTLLFKG